MNSFKLLQVGRPLLRTGYVLSPRVSAPPTTRGVFSRNPLSSKIPPQLHHHDIDRNISFTSADIWSEMDRMERQMNRLVERTLGRDWTWPTTAAMTRPSRLALRESDYVPVEVNEDGSRTYRQHYLVAGCEPENVKVSIDGRIITIKAKGEFQTNGSKSVREHTLSYSLPDEVDPEKVRTYLADGYLTIEAPLPPVEPTKQVHELEIERKSTGQIGSGQDKQVGSN